MGQIYNFKLLIYLWNPKKTIQITTPFLKLKTPENLLNREIRDNNKTKALLVLKWIKTIRLNNQKEKLRVTTKLKIVRIKLPASMTLL